VAPNVIEDEGGEEKDWDEFYYHVQARSQKTCLFAFDHKSTEDRRRMLRGRVRARPLSRLIKEEHKDQTPPIFRCSKGFLQDMPDSSTAHSFDTCERIRCVRISRCEISSRVPLPLNAVGFFLNVREIGRQVATLRKHPRCVGGFLLGRQEARGSKCKHDADAAHDGRNDLQHRRQLPS
jgi:hypothetical protein